ncbi:MAG: hypothetical protein WHT45_12605 [Ignavibacterium sp.]
MTKENFIDGIYNYCDRWCERCNFTDRCRLFYLETERNVQHIINDEDPQDPNVFTKDIEESLSETMNMISEKMEEMNIDPEDIDDNNFPIEYDYDAYPINILASNFKDSMGLIEELHNFYGLNTIDAIDKNTMTNELKEIKENLSILSWYSPMVYVKIKSLIRANEDYKTEDDEEIKEIIKEEIFVTGKLLYIALTKSLSALSNLHEYCSELSDQIIDMMILLTKIKDDLLKMYPEIPDYKRPYFD